MTPPKIPRFRAKKVWVIITPGGKKLPYLIDDGHKALNEAHRLNIILDMHLANHSYDMEERKAARNRLRSDRFQEKHKEQRRLDKRKYEKRWPYKDG